MNELQTLIADLGINLECNQKLPGHINGFYYKNEADEFIIVNSKVKDEKEFRYTLAHELGHYFTTITTKSAFPYSIYTNILNTHRNESRAIRWACDYLVPTYELIEFLKSEKDASVSDIAHKFEISEELLNMKFYFMSLDKTYWPVDEKRYLVLASLPSVYMYTPL